MSEKFKNKYRIPSARLKNWDYGSNASYYITICTHDREHFFGDVLDKKMYLSEIGKIAEQYWYEIPRHFSFVELGAFVVMPNHVHGILIFNKNDDGTRYVETPNLGVSTTAVLPTTVLPTTVPPTAVLPTTVPPTAVPPTVPSPASQKWKPATLGVILNQYKRICTINARKIHADFAWQTRFYDHIIRNDESYQRISEYIIDNPANWNDDEFKTPNTNNQINKC